MNKRLLHSGTRTRRRSLVHSSVRNSDKFLELDESLDTKVEVIIAACILIIFLTTLGMALTN